MIESKLTSELLRNFLKVSIRMLCLLGCVYQTYKISLLYFSYETTTNVRYETSDGKILDTSVTVCPDKEYFVVKSRNFSNGNLTSELTVLNKMSIRKQFSLLNTNTIHCVFR